MIGDNIDIGDKFDMLKPIRLLAMDVDGVLTDGTLVFDGQGGEQKHFHVADGLGMAAIRMAGISVAWLSGLRETPNDAFTGQ